MTTEEKIIKNKLGLLNLAHQLGNVSQACRVMGYSRESFRYFLFSECKRTTIIGQFSCLWFGHQQLY
jgi:hypothetical protein